MTFFCIIFIDLINPLYYNHYIMEGNNMKKMYEWLSKNKDNSGVGIAFLKFVYSMVTINWIQPIIDALFAIFISIILGNNSDNWHTWWFISIVCMFILENIGYGFCISYSHREFRERRLYDRILKDVDSVIKSLDIWIQDEYEWKKKIFRKTCDLVCANIHTNFKEIFHSKVRVSIEYSFWNQNSMSCIKMVSRYSDSRHIARDRTFFLKDRQKYYSGKILMNNKVGVHFLQGQDFYSGWYKNEVHNTEIKQYLAVAVSADEQQKVSFVLQIDSLDDSLFGNNKVEASDFTDKYLKAYINLIAMAYNINRDNNGNIPEV